MQAVSLVDVPQSSQNMLSSYLECGLACAHLLYAGAKSKLQRQVVSMDCRTNGSTASAAATEAPDQS